MVYIFSSFEAYRYAKPENPMPAVEAIKSIRFVDRASEAGTEFIIPTNLFPVFHLLFEGSRIDVRPAKWVILGDLFITLHSGDTLRLDIFSTHQPSGAFKLNGQYYRGGTDNQFKKMLTREISNTAPGTYFR
jgi:hypothetical protein